MECPGRVIRSLHVATRSPVTVWTGRGTCSARGSHLGVVGVLLLDGEHARLGVGLPELVVRQRLERRYAYGRERFVGQRHEKRGKWSASGPSLSLNFLLRSVRTIDGSAVGDGHPVEMEQDPDAGRDERQGDQRPSAAEFAQREDTLSSLGVHAGSEQRCAT